VKRSAPSALRNREPILAELRTILPARGAVLELACGSGEHATYFAAALPGLTWQPTDVDPDALTSTNAHRAELGDAAPNLRPAVHLDARAPAWPVAEALGPLAAIVAINVIHISPWSATEGLVAGAARHLTPDGALVTYGPYRFGGAFTAPSNAAFDESLRARDPAWGVRDVDDLDALAAAHGLVRRATIALPANNHLLVFRRARASA
jgi:SAM-dependent methyltransferase